MIEGMTTITARTTADTDHTEAPLEIVESAITRLSGQIAAATALLMGWIAEYDRRAGWKSWGCQSCAQWLSWKCGDDPHTAREKVRVARALEVLPVISAAFAGGEISYSKVRAITRVALPADQQEWLTQALSSTGSQLERAVSGVRRALERNESVDARDAFDRRRANRSDRAGCVSALEVRAPSDLVATVWAAVEVITSRQIEEACAGSESSRRDVIADRGGMAAIHADALLEMAERVLADDSVAAQRGDIGRLGLVAEMEALQGVADADIDEAAAECTLGGRRVAPVVAKRMACDIVAEVLVETADGHGCDVGRDTRVVNRKLRRALHRRDNGMCRFPGCGASSWLHAHHVVHWADGGHTRLDNLVSLCGFHHRLVHEGGWTVSVVESAVVWSGPDGVPATIDPLGGDVGELVDEVGDCSVPEPTLASGRLDFHFVVSVLAEHCARQRRAARRDVPAGTPDGGSENPRLQRASVSMSSPRPE